MRTSALPLTLKDRESHFSMSDQCPYRFDGDGPGGASDLLADSGFTFPLIVVLYANQKKCRDVVLPSHSLHNIGPLSHDHQSWLTARRPPQYHALVVQERQDHPARQPETPCIWVSNTQYIFHSVAQCIGRNDPQRIVNQAWCRYYVLYWDSTWPARLLQLCRSPPSDTRGWQTGHVRKAPGGSLP